MKKRIGIIGHFGGNEFFNDGQTVKVKSLYKGLNLAVGDVYKIDKVDTYYLKNSKYRLLIELIKCILFDKKIIFLPAMNGRKKLFPLMYILKRILHKDIYHDCIGGALVNELYANKNWKKYLNSFNSNWMESEKQVSKLYEMGISNVFYIPNFKNIMPITESELVLYFDKPIKFCTFSRVLPEKGIADAVNAVKHLNEVYGSQTAMLDIYGPIQSGYETWFLDLIDNNRSCCKYCGVINPKYSVNVLKDYFALLFPTHYFTEGMPGTIIDAMFAGVPVISRKWMYCDQMIENGFNGVSYDFDKPENIVNILEECINDPESFVKMRINCIEEAKKYLEKNVINQIVNKMEL